MVLFQPDVWQDGSPTRIDQRAFVSHGPLWTMCDYLIVYILTQEAVSILVSLSSVILQYHSLVSLSCVTLCVTLKFSSYTRW